MRSLCYFKNFVFPVERAIDQQGIDRRTALKTATSALGALVYSRPLFGASDFWNRKSPAEWSSQEIEQLFSHSPWAKEVNAEFIEDTDYTTGAAAGPSIGRGGIIGAPGAGSGTPSQIEVGRNARDPSAGAKRQQPVTVRWESAKPIREGLGIRLSPAFNERYVISVSGLPFGVMHKRRRGLAEDAPPEDQSPAARQRRMIEQLQGSATLQAKGQEPEQAGVVEAAPRTPGTYLFGFSKELLPLDDGAKEILFTLQTAMMTVKAKFEPKAMLYRGHLAL